MVFGCKWVGGGGNVHTFLMVRDFDGALGKRLWMSGRGLGVAWIQFGTPCEILERFGGQPRHHLRRLGTHGGGLGTVLMLSGNLRGSTWQGDRKDDNT